MNKLTTSFVATAIVSTGFLLAFANATTASDQPSTAAGPTQFVCSGEAGWRLNIGLGFMANKLNLSEEQTSYFEAFKSAALSAQTSSPEECVAQIQPKFEILFDSLTEEQKLNLPGPDNGDQQQSS